MVILNPKNFLLHSEAKVIFFSTFEMTPYQALNKIDRIDKIDYTRDPKIESKKDKLDFNNQ